VNTPSKLAAFDCSTERIVDVDGSEAEVTGDNAGTEFAECVFDSLVCRRMLEEKFETLTGACGAAAF